jgi:4-hydroxy-3-methylbut-2-enyl diphosphate reductase
MKILLANPRGFCAGVVRAIDTVEIALRRFPPPIYVRKEIVHNKIVVEGFQKRGVVFIDSLEEAPEGSLVVFSAHGVSPEVRRRARSRRLRVIDATCPLVTKVHLEVHSFLKKGYTFLLIGHRDHDEVDGTLGEAPDKIFLVETPEDVARAPVPDPDHLMVLTQTTLSVDETRGILAAVKRRFPHAAAPAKDDICYATQNRQLAVKQMAPQTDLMIVVGSRNSSNSVRLVEVALEHGAAAGHLVDFADEIDPSWLAGVATVGVTSGASVPEVLVRGVLAFLAEHGYEDVQPVAAAEESVLFSLPHELRRDLRAKSGVDASTLRHDAGSLH